MKFAHIVMIFLLLVGMVLLAGGASYHHFSYWSAHASSLPMTIQDRPAAHFAGVNELVVEPKVPAIALPPVSLPAAPKASLPAVSTQPPPQPTQTQQDKNLPAAQPGLVAAANTAQKPTAKPAANPVAQTTQAKPAVEASRVLPSVPVRPMQVAHNQALAEQKPLAIQTIKPAMEPATTRPGSVRNQPAQPNKFANPGLQANPLGNKNPNQAFSEQPVLAIYSDYLTLDFAPNLVSEQNIKRALGRVFLSPDPYAEQDLLSRAPMTYKQRPALYRQVLNQKNQPIRFPNDAFAYADHLLKAYRYQITQQPGLALQVKVPLSESNLQDPARRYEHWVLEFGRKYNIKPALVFAVMETESNFNPRAVSRSQAKGLMQIKPNSAGRDVYKLIDAKIGAPSDAELFDEAGNIRLGVAYLSLLKYEYLAGVKHPEIREMVAISSYNGGLSTVLKLFGDTPEKAVQTINRSSKAKVYQTLRYQHASNETRQYLDKVLRAKNKYQALLGDDNQLLASR